MARLHHRGLLASASGLFSFLALLATPLAAQSSSVVLRGRVADAADNPLPAAVVLLHAVGQGSGVEVARDTADDGGRFELAFTPEEGPLYFVATRIDRDIFMSEPFRNAPPPEVVLRAGAGVEPLSLDGFQATPARQPVRAGREDSHGGWWVAAIGAALVGLITWIVRRGRHRPPRARELLLEIARLDENRASAGGPANDDAWRVRRADLRHRLVEALELDRDADRH